MTLDLESAEKIKRISDETGKLVYIDLFYKFSTLHKYAIDLIQREKSYSLDISKATRESITNNKVVSILNNYYIIFCRS